MSRDNPDGAMTERHDPQDLRDTLAWKAKQPPIDLAAFANKMFYAGMAARHAPVPDLDPDPRQQWDAETREEYEAYLDTTKEEPCK